MRTPGRRAKLPDPNVAVNLSKYVTELAERIEDPALLKAGAEAMAESMKRATARYLGSDLRMHNFRGDAPTFKTETKTGAATVEIGGGTYALADGGRRQAKRAYPRRGRALSTPWGPRASAKGSTWGGFHITERHAPEALDDGIRAIIFALDQAVG